MMTVTTAMTAPTQQAGPDRRSVLPRRAAAALVLAATTTPLFAAPALATTPAPAIPATTVPAPKTAATHPAPAPVTPALKPAVTHHPQATATLAPRPAATHRGHTTAKHPAATPAGSASPASTVPSWLGLGVKVRVGRPGIVVCIDTNLVLINLNIQIVIGRGQCGPSIHRPPKQTEKVRPP
jgi:hypothetical protein